MKNHYHAIYLSPHLDDAVLSCGGYIVKQTSSGKSVLIVTITAGDPPTESVSGYAQSLQERWALRTDAAAGRRAEDLTACAIVGADARHWAVPDCIYRRDRLHGTTLYHSDGEIFGEIHPAEAGLVGELTTQLAALPRFDQLFVPLTLGHHVDHQLTKAAAEARYPNDARVVYYEDYPYAEKAGAVDELLAASPIAWEAETIPLADAEIQTKIAAIAAFRSQLSTFWGSRAELEAAVLAFVAKRGGERYWRKI